MVKVLFKYFKTIQLRAKVYFVNKEVFKVAVINLNAMKGE